MFKLSLQAGCGMFAGVALIVVPLLAKINIFDFPWLYCFGMFVAGMFVASICADYFVLAPTWIVLGECIGIRDWGDRVSYFFILHFAAVPAYIGAIAGVFALQLIDSYKLRQSKSSNELQEQPFWEKWN